MKVREEVVAEDPAKWHSLSEAFAAIFSRELLLARFCPGTSILGFLGIAILHSKWAGLEKSKRS